MANFWNKLGYFYLQHLVTLYVSVPMNSQCCFLFGDEQYNCQTNWDSCYSDSQFFKKNYSLWSHQLRDWADPAPYLHLLFLPLHCGWRFKLCRVWINGHSVILRHEILVAFWNFKKIANGSERPSSSSSSHANWKFNQQQFLQKFKHFVHLLTEALFKWDSSGRSCGSSPLRNRRPSCSSSSPSCSMRTCFLK